MKVARAVSGVGAAVLLLVAGCASHDQAGSGPTTSAARTPTPTAAPSSSATPSATPTPSPTPSSPAARGVTVKVTSSVKPKSKYDKQTWQLMTVFWPAYEKSLAAHKLDPALYRAAPTYVEPMETQFAADKKAHRTYSGTVIVTVTKIDASASRATVQACVDASALTVTAKGKSERQTAGRERIAVDYVRSQMFGSGLAVRTITDVKGGCS